MHISELPAPLLTLFYYDGPIHYASLDDNGNPIILFLCDQNEHKFSFFVGRCEDEDIVNLMLGKETLCDCIRRVCTHQLDYHRNNTMTIVPVDTKEVNEDYLPSEDFHFTPWALTDITAAINNLHTRSKPC